MLALHCNGYYLLNENDPERGIVEQILLSPYSFGRLAPLVLTIIASAFLFVRKQRHPADRLLALYFLFLSVFNAGFFVAYSTLSSAGAFGWILSATCVFGIVVLIQFAYRFPSASFGREPVIVLCITMTIAAGGFIDYLIHTIKDPVILSASSWGSAYSSKIIPVTVVMFYCWVILIFIRHIIKDSLKNGERNLFLLIKYVFKPETARSRTAQTFGLLVFMELFNSALVLSVMTIPSINAENRILLVQNAAMLLIYSLYVIVYLNGTGETISFKYKIIGIPMVTILIAVTAAGYISLTQREDTYDDARAAEMKYTGTLIQSGSFSDLPPQIDYIAENTGNGIWKTVFSRNESFPENIDIRLYKTLPSAKLFTDNNSREGIAETIHSGERYFTQIAGVNYFQFHVLLHDKMYGAGFSYGAYRKYMHTPSLILSLTLLLSLVFALTVFPLLTQKGVMRPLDRLVEDMKSIRSADADILFNSADEIAFLSRSIGEIAKIKKETAARKELPVQITPSVKEKLDNVLDYIGRNYREDISREGLAAMVDLAPTYLGKMFKIYTGRRIGDLINNLRIEEARELLEKGDMPVIDIAFAVGFESVRTFNRVFLKEVSMQPSEYRASPGSNSGKKV